MLHRTVSYDEVRGIPPAVLRRQSGITANQYFFDQRKSRSTRLVFAPPYRVRSYDQRKFINRN